MKLTVLGSGTSSGVPLIGCSCSVCLSANPKNKRWRSSCLFEVNGKKILIDSGPDLRNQALAFNLTHIDAVLYTHTHADHVHGIDDLRHFCEHHDGAMPVYGAASDLDRLKEKFEYIFNPSLAYPSLVPKLKPIPVADDFKIEDIEVQVIPCLHGAAGITTNYRIGNIAWLTDVNGISASSLEKLNGLDYLFIDGLRHKPHPTHFCLEQSIKAAKKIAAKKTYFIHLAHDYDHDEFNKTLPEGMELAYDGLVAESQTLPD